MNTRCQYCGKEIAEGEDFCSDSCASAYRTATGTKLSDLKWLLIGIAVSLFVILWGPITRNEQMVGVGVALLGFVVAKWPLATPETVRKVGYVASHEICRAIGVTVIPLGLTTTFFM
ncbi:MAG: DUF2116 family Zn-ribbon domain-containing protein [Peptococcaceae bacterium]|mgnify:FL=1|nr:DUF2116 family Zn-ribbon domain-containing protein [Peptococcaceae bacterium]